MLDSARHKFSGRVWKEINVLDFKRKRMDYLFHCDYFLRDVVDENDSLNVVFGQSLE